MAAGPVGSRPDYGRAEVRHYLVDNAVSWLRDYRLDGLRLDATAYIRNIVWDGDPSQDIPDGWQLLEQINDAIDGSQPWKITIAEDMQDNDWITRPTAAQGPGSTPSGIRASCSRCVRCSSGTRTQTVICAHTQIRAVATADTDRERSPALTTEGNRGVLSQPGAGAVLRDRKAVTPIIRNTCRSSGRMPARDSS